MNDLNQKLSSCFTNTFPRIRPNEIPGASTASLAAWDSVAHITLLSSIAEEFSVEFSPEEFEELTSYTLIEDCLRNRLAG